MKVRCPTCWTIFLVAPEQLTAREGQVRCGQCQEIFNAFDNLLNEEDERADSPDPAVDNIAPIASEASISRPQETTTLAADNPLSGAADATNTATADDPAPTEPAAQGNGTSASAATQNAGTNPEKTPPPVVQTPVEPTQSTATNEPPAPKAGAPAIHPTPDMSELLANAKWTESFLAKSFGYSDKTNRPFKWMSVFLAALLVCQSIGHFRGEIALKFPALRSSLELVSRAFGADVPLPRHAEQIHLDVSDMQKDPEHNLLLLEALLRNRANYEQAYPSLELSLTDIHDKAIARRVFAPGEYLPLKFSLMRPFAANAEINIRLWIEVQNIEPVGYRLELIYP